MVIIPPYLLLESMPIKILLTWVGLSGVVVALTLFRYAGTQGVNYDDVFIVLVYAKHFLASGTFYWNIQDGNLDGFTSLLDLLLKSLASAAYPQDRLAAVWWLNLLFHLAIPLLGMVLVTSFQEGISGARRLLPPLLAGLALATNESLAVSAASLLEGPLFVVLTLSALILVLRKPVPSIPFILLLCLLPLARPEGTAFSLLLGCWYFYIYREDSTFKRMLPLALFMTFIGVFIVWRLYTFGYWAPNTYYAKTSVNRLNEIKDGLAYVWAYAHSPAGGLLSLVVLILPSLAVIRRWHSQAARLRFILLALSGVSMMGVVILAGGDSYNGSRFMHLNATLAIIAMACAISGLQGHWKGLPLTVLATLLIVQLLVDFPQLERKQDTVQNLWPISEQNFGCDRWIAEKLSPMLNGLTVAQSDYQMFKYFADEVQVIDLHGLNDREIAHQPWERPVKWGKFNVLSGLERNPDIWFFGYHIGSTTALPINKVGMRAALSKPEIYNKSFGYSATAKGREMLIDRYRPVTMTCGPKVYNFLIEKSHIPRFRYFRMPVGGQ